MSQLQDQGEGVRRETHTLIEALEEKAREFELPNPPEELREYGRKLADDTYRVLVAGEAKRGKSTFVNAMIGRNLLPTDVDIATSQVFRVANAGREAYRLRFEDDSTQEIAVEDLRRYGSQTLADREGAPRMNEIIRWIEVDVPVRFFPPGVSLLDTPGLGGLYAAHARITNRFVPQADAVLFVLDSERPIIHSEIEFIDALLAVTRNIFFIQTKIDMFDKEHWQAILRRNQEILDEKFQERLPDKSVWPISSTNLMNAGQSVSSEDSEIYLMVSRHGEMASALQSFLLRVAGWSRAAEAIYVADYYHATSRQVLVSRIGALDEQTEGQRADQELRAIEERRRFGEDWGEPGQKRKALMEELGEIIDLAKRGMSQALQSGGVIHEDQRSKIKALTSLQEAKARNERIADEVNAEALKHWKSTLEKTNQLGAELFSPLISEAESLGMVPEAWSADPVFTRRPSLELEGLWWKKMKGALREQAAVTSIIGGVGGILAFAFPATIPAIIIAGAAAELWSLFYGRKEVERRELQGAKSALIEHAEDVLRRVRQHFFDVDEAALSNSYIDRYFSELETAVSKKIDDLVARKLENSAAELARFREESQFSEAQRKARADELQQQLATWDGFGKSISDMVEQLKKLDQSLASVGALGATEPK